MWEERGIKIHWSPHRCERSPDTDEFIDLCYCAEVCGFESVHVPFAHDLSTALALATRAARTTSRLNFRIGGAFENVLSSLLGREMKKAWEILEHRLIVHLSFSVEESSATEHRFLQAGEFLTNCRGLFDRYQRPEFDVEGESAGAAFVAIKYADCLWRRPAHPPQVYADALPVLHFGKQVGLVTSAVARETRGQALDTAARLLPETLAESLKDAASWVTPSIWRANVADGQEQRAMLVGSFDEVAGAMYGFKQRSILQFLIRTPMEQRDVECFGMNVLPRIRDLEARGRRSAQQITFIGGEC